MKKITLIYISFLLSSGCHSFVYCESIDAEVMRSIHTKRNTNYDELMKGISNSSYIILPAIPIGLFANYKICDCEDKLYNSINIGSAIIVTGAVSLLLKEIIKQPRPYEVYDFVDNIGKERGYSMPSMHTSTAFSLATSLTLIEPKWYVIIPSYLWATAVAYSRIHLGVHTLSDVIIGSVVGAGISIGTNAIVKQMVK